MRYANNVKKHPLLKIILHPALLFEAGNLALAFGYAETLAIIVNTILLIAILTVRWIAVTKKKPYDISFGILAGVNFFTAGSVIYNGAIVNSSITLGVVIAALAYTFWAIGHLYAGRKRSAATALTNPQFHYGIADMMIVNVQGTLNPYAFPFTVLGFLKSLFIGKKKKLRNATARHLYETISSARLYAAAFMIGALTSLAVPHLLIAQLCWALAYLQFGKDTK